MMMMMMLLLLMMMMIMIDISFIIFCYILRGWKQQEMHSFIV